MNLPSHRSPARWSIALAFTLLYLSWGTTFLAIRAGVYNCELPPCLFGGTRVCLAGVLVLLYLRLRGESLAVPRRELLATTLAGLLLFVGGNGLMNAAMGSVLSGVAAVLVGSTPLWMALMETFWPGGERLSARGWLGLAVGMAGILIICGPQLENPAEAFRNVGPLLVLGSTLTWALGTLILRHRTKAGGTHLTAAAYQMVLGGGALSLIGLGLGEAGRLTPDKLTAGAAAAYVYLLVVGSLVGFIAYNWLLGHVSTARVGTYAYVNPLVAIFVGWLLGGEPLTASVMGGVAVILAGVALVRGAEAHAVRRKRPSKPRRREIAPV